MTARTPVTALLSYLAGRPEQVDTSAWTDAEWGRLIDEAERREVEALLYSRIRAAASPPPIPPHLDRRLAELYCIAALRSRKASAELAVALEALRSAGVDVIVLKGAYLASDVYDDASLRVMGDFDLLVPADGLGRAEGALLALGYVPHREAEIEETLASSHHRPPLRKQGCTPIELHWNIEGPRAPMQVDLPGLWERSRPVTIAAVAVRRLGAEDLIVHLCLHAAFHHRWGADRDRELVLRPICDIALAIERHGRDIDWDSLVEIVMRGRMGRYVFSALAVARRLLGADVPAAVLKGLRPNERDRAAVDSIAELLGTTTTIELPVAYRQWVRGGRFADRLRSVALATFPGPQRLRELYGLPSGSPRVYGYYLLRPLDLVRRRGWALAQVTLHSGEGRSLMAQEQRRLRIARWLDD